MVKNTG